MRLIFCGTPRFAVPTLEELVEAGHSVPLVVTQPDRPRGRGMELAISPVKESALHLGLPVVQPDKIKHNEEFRGQLSGLHPDAIIVVGYGRIIPQWMIDLPRHGNLNLHASLLPKYRGAAPIQWAIAEGETITGVTTMRIDAGLDTGDILMQRELPISADDTAETLAPKLASAGASLMAETLRAIESDQARPTPQDNAKATLAPILTKDDGRVDFERTATEIFNRQRGFQPWPGAHTLFRGRHLQIHGVRPLGQEMDQEMGLGPGELRIEATRLLAGCGKNTAMELIELQPEGKRRMLARDFINGYQPIPGEKLGR
ncbi:MAG TPA: methionyl-tRNA formyltransferase [Terriglobales bacterium]|jgi:methionyl-tRNA formyltransferase|nr:methionyl-tRNA formyltransferase [Terriglobales bacterium]